MCTPHAPEANPQASLVPSMQSADNLQIGGAGAPRGAAGLGRLALRFGASPSISPAATASATTSAVAANTPAPIPSAFAPAAEAQQPGVGTTPGSLAGLRFGNFNTAFA